MTYVAVAHDRPIGFATVAASQIEIADLPPGNASSLPHYPLPVLRLARMAVHEAAQGHGVGKLLLRYVFQVAHDMAESVGCVGVVVDAKPGATGFYAKLGFRVLKARVGLLGDRPEPEPMYVHLSAVPKT